MNAKQANRIRHGIIAGKYATPATIGSWLSAYSKDRLWKRAYWHTLARAALRNGGTVEWGGLTSRRGQVQRRVTRG